MEVEKLLKKMVTRKRTLSREKVKLENRLSKVAMELELLQDDLDFIHKNSMFAYINMKAKRDVREKEEAENLKSKKAEEKIQLQKEREQEKVRKKEEAEARHKNFREARRQEVIANAKKFEEEVEYEEEDKEYENL